MNKVILGGYLGWIKPETTSTQKDLTRLSIATDKKVKGEKKTSWHKAVGFSKVAELLAANFSVGDFILIEGELSHSSWEKDGQTISKTEVIVHQISWGACRTSKEGQDHRNNEPEPSFYRSESFEKDLSNDDPF